MPNIFLETLIELNIIQNPCGIKQRSKLLKIVCVCVGGGDMDMWL